MINDEQSRSIFLDRLGILEGIKIIDPEAVKAAAKTPLRSRQPTNTIEREILDKSGIVITNHNKVQLGKAREMPNGSIQFNASDSRAHLVVTPHANS